MKLHTINTPDITDWVDKLSQEELPMFAHTARKIASLSSDSLTSVGEMTQVILSDTAMTARVLRMANSAYYNPSSHRINTVSRAIVLLGFDAVRNIALSISMIDTMLSGVQHDRALEELARSFHAAIQAKELALAMEIEGAEEIFIAALLHRLGKMIFWCFPYGYAYNLDYEYSRSEDEDKAESAVLGFTLNDLTQNLAEEWQLSSLLQTALKDQENGDKKVAAISKGYAMALASEKGWRSEEICHVLLQTSELLNIQVSEAADLAYSSARKAIKTITDMGLEQVAYLVATPPRKDQPLETESEVEEVDQHFQLQMSIMRELTIMMSDRFDINTVLGTILEGIYRSLQMDRALFALVDSQSKNLVGKYALGQKRDVLLNGFRFSLERQDPNLFAYIMNNKEPFWFGRKNRSRLSHLVTDSVKNSIGMVEFFAMPIRIGGQYKGMIYADRKINGEPLSEMRFQTFRHFCEHANIAFQILRSNSSN